MLILSSFVKNGLITEKQSVEIGKTLEKDYDGDVVRAVIAGGANSTDVLNFVSEETGIPVFTKDAKEVATDVAGYVTEESAKQYKIVPLELVDGALSVGLEDPFIQGVRDAVRFISETKNVAYKLFLITPALYDEVVGRYGGVGAVAQDVATEEKKSEDDEELKTIFQEDAKPVDVTSTLEDAPMRRVLSTIIRDAIAIGASDIHIENEGPKGIKVRYRIDGELETKSTMPASSSGSLLALIKLNAKLLLDEHRKPQDGSFSVVYQNRKIDLRVSTIPSYYGEKAVIRILDKAKGVLTLKDLGMNDDQIKITQDALHQPYGMVLITGPTGSGKSTTMFAMVSEFDLEKENIVSLEDPIEYEIDNITQSQIHSAIGYTFANGLRSVLRQDPNVIMVGEIRDKETAELAIQAALTGHMVIATLHTNTAVGAIPRLIDMGIDPYLIAPTLTLVIAQRLVRTFANESTRKSVALDVSLKEMYEGSIKDLPADIQKKVVIPENIFEPLATKEYPTGMKGRTPVFEMFDITKEMQHLILNNPKEDEVYKLARSQGMYTMREDAFNKAFAGKIPFKEVYSV